MNSTNFHDFADDDPLFLRFSKTFESRSQVELNNEITQFEASHPHLTLVTFDDFTKEVLVYGNYLFSDKKKHYRELLYTFKIFREIRYYEPDPLLYKWLERIDTFAISRKN
jgi:hypothetical protein